MPDKRAGERPSKGHRDQTTATDLTADRAKARETWADLPERGGVSANQTARPRDPETIDGEEETPVGFTTTSVTGSAGGRALYGARPEDEREEDEE